MAQLKHLVITSFAPDHWNTHAQRCVRSFLEKWPCPLVIYYEEKQPPPFELPNLPNFYQVDLMQRPVMRRWMETYHKDARTQGKKANSDELNFRFMADKFCRKVFAITDAAEQFEADYLWWLDADTLTHETITTSWLEALIRPKDYLCFLGRSGYSHSECGFMGWRTQHPAHKMFMARYRAIYETGQFFQEQEWHDSYLFDVVRKKMEWEGHFTATDLSPSPRGHVFVESILGTKMDHLKGTVNKKVGKTVRKQRIRISHSEKYWQEE